MTVIDAFERFIQKKRLKNCSPKTIEDYTQFVMPFIMFVGPFSDVLVIDTSAVLGYIETLYSRPLADASRATYITHIKAFLRWLKDMYAIPVSLSEIDAPKVGKKAVHILTADEVRHLFSCISGSPEWIRLRNLCIISLMLDSGMRQNEVAVLQWHNTNLVSHVAIVHGKGNKERPVALGQLSVQCLQNYRSACPYMLDFVFAERNGTPLSNNAIKLMVQRLKCSSGIDFSSHKLRHNYATNFCLDSLESTGQCDMYTLKELMGHEDLKTTEKYLHYAKKLLAVKNSHSHLDSIFGV